MGDPRDELAVRSYRLCFALERRIFRIDRWRIPAPYGVPLSGLGYAVLALALVVVLQGLPVAGELLGVLHPALRFVILPVAVAYAAARLQVDGRSAHAAAAAWLRWRAAPARVTVGGDVVERGPRLLGDMAVAVDEAAARYRPCIVRGPAELLLRYPARAMARRRRLEIHAREGGPLWRAKRIRLGERQFLRLR